MAGLTVAPMISIAGRTVTDSRHTIFSPDPSIGVEQQERRANRLGRLGIVNLGILGQGLFLVVQHFQLRLNA